MVIIPFRALTKYFLNIFFYLARADLAKLLIERDASIKAVNKSGKTPLDIATEKGKQKETLDLSCFFL